MKQHCLALLVCSATLGCGAGDPLAGSIDGSDPLLGELMDAPGFASEEGALSGERGIAHFRRGVFPVFAPRSQRILIYGATDQTTEQSLSVEQRPCEEGAPPDCRENVLVRGEPTLVVDNPMWQDAEFTRPTANGGTRVVKYKRFTIPESFIGTRRGFMWANPGPRRYPQVLLLDCRGTACRRVFYGDFLRDR